MNIPHQIVETLFAHGDAPLFVWGNEPGWPVSYVSENIRALTGYDVSQFLTRRVLYADLVHPDDLDRLEECVAAAILSGATRFQHEDYRLQHAAGHWIWVHDVAVIERDEAGEATSFVGYVVDVTEKHERAASMMKQRDRMQLVLEGTRLGMWDWNPQTGEVLFDERWAQMLGYELDEIEFTLESWSNRMHPDDLAECYEAIQAHMDGETEFYEHVHRMQHKDGHWVHVLDRGRICARDAEGRPTRFTGTHTDISAQRRAELEAREASRVKSEFLARMSHEIRTPLNGVLGVLQLLATTRLDEQQQRYVDVVGESSETLLTIINDVLDSSKIEAGEMKIESRVFDVRRMLHTIHDLYRERAVTNGLDYRLDIADAVPQHLKGDPHRIRQILSNLLSNAFKFTEQGSVELAARAERMAEGRVELVLSVRDTGIGIEDPAAVWVPFRQADVSIARKYGGTGLGLTICRQLTELMGGSMELETAFGERTEFSIRLPLEVANSEAIPRSDADADADENFPKLDILVAEDNAINQMVISSVLKHLGQRVTVVEDGAAALAECQGRNFDLVFMDIHMPEMDGIEASRRIRGEVSLDRQPRIVALSADAFAPEDDSYRVAQFDGAVSKPFKIADIAKIIRGQ